MTFNFPTVLWTMGIILLTFEICIILFDGDVAYGPIFSFLVLITGFILGVAFTAKESR